MRKLAIVLVATFASGCITTQEMPIAPNAVRLDTKASGLLSMGQSVPQTMRKAAQATLAAGYTHFKLADTQSGQGHEFSGVYATGSDTSSFAIPLYRHTEGVSTTVIMYHATDPGAKDAFKAEDVLKEYPQ